MTTPTTPEQAREIAQNLFFPGGETAFALRSLADQVEALTKERDEWKARCEFSFEQRDKLHAQLETLQYEVDAIPAIKAERDDLSARYETASRLVTSLSDALANALKERDAYEKCADTMAAAHKVERDALKDVARLALDALECSEAYVGCESWSPSMLKEVQQVIAALKAVL